MSALRDEIIRQLADGKQHSIKALAGALNTDVQTIERIAPTLAEVGLRPERPATDTLALPNALQLLDRDSIQQLVEEDACLDSVEIYGSIESTNTYLLDKTPPPAGHMDACVAEFQTQGRGRRQRSWVAPYASGICLSLGWTCEAVPPAVSTLSLVIGVAVRRALAACGVDEIRLKWPNDIIFRGSKLGGVLTELRHGARDAVRIVAGVGINVSLPGEVRRMIDRTAKISCTDLTEAAGGPKPNRDRVAAELILALSTAVRKFDQSGFAAFKDEWRQLDVTDGQQVELIDGEEYYAGTACGIDDDGALLVDVAGTQRRFLAGDVSLRMTQ